MSLRDRWSSWWTGTLDPALADARDENVELAQENEALRAACSQAVQVIDLYRAQNRRLTEERDRAVRDLRDVLGLRSRNDVMSMLRPEENE